MSGVNKVILVGHLGKDPEITQTRSGAPVAQFSCATSETWRDKATGERKQSTEWHQIVIFNEGLVKIAEQYLKKGSKVYIEGQIRTRKWTDNSGQERYRTEIVLPAFRGSITLLDRAERAPAPDDDSYGSGNDAAPAGIDDEIPF